MKGSWRTTALGALTILGVLVAAGKTLVDGDPLTNPDWPMVISGCMGGFGLIQARDNKVTSEQAGAK